MKWRWLILVGVIALACLVLPDWHEHPAQPPLAPPPPPQLAPVVTPRPPAKPVPAVRTDLADAVEMRASLLPGEAAIRIVWIGDTRARLDSCSCHQRIKITEAASLFRRLAQGPPRTVLLDAGGAVDGDTALDHERTRAYAAVLKQLSFSAIAVGGGRGHLTQEALDDLAAAGPPLLAGDAEIRLSLGERSLSIVCVDSAPAPVPDVMEVPVDHAGVKGPRWVLPDVLDQAKAPLARMRARGDLVAVVGDLSRSDALRLAASEDAPDLILSCRSIVTGSTLADKGRNVAYEDFRERAGKTSLYGMTSSSFGAIRSLELGADGAEIAYGMYNVNPGLAPDPAVNALVEGFFQRVSSDASLSALGIRRFPREALENDASNGYVGAAECVRCHAAQGAQWKRTQHASATRKLEVIERHYYPGCITCHSTGYGWESGYLPRDEKRTELQNVGCETCHGPGRRHSASPKEAGLIRRGSPTLCIECHDGKDAVPLGARLKEAYKSIRH